MKHIVLIVGSYYPNYSAVGKCMGNIANELAKDNRVTVVCEKTSLDQSDSDMVGLQKIIRVTTKRKERYLRHNDNKQLRGKIFNTIKGNYYTAERFIYRLLSKTSIDKEMVSAYEKALTLIKDKIDVIVPTCSPFESVVAATKYKKYDESVEVIPYLFDLFSGNNNLNYFEIIKRIKWESNIALEKDAFCFSKKVLHVDNWSQHISNNLPEYLDKCILVEHPLLVVNDFDKNKNNMNDDNLIHVTYAGVVDLKVRNPEKAFQVMSGISNEQIVFDIYSYGSAQCVVNDYSKLHKNIKNYGKVDGNIASEALASSHLLISFGNSDYSQVPSKLIEYIALGKPIIHFALDERDPAIKVLESYPCKLIVYLNRNNDSYVLENFIISNYNERFDLKEIYQLYRNADPQYISKLITDENSMQIGL